MSRIVSLLVGGALVAAAGSAPAAARPSPDAELAKAIQGRVAGEPVDCINLRIIRSSKVIDKTAIVYDAGSVVYVNRPRAGGQLLDRWDILVTKTFSTQLCSIDVVRLYDPSSKMETGAVFLGDFVPYTKVKGG